MIIWADFPSGQQGIYGTDETKMLDGVWAAMESYDTTKITLESDPDPSIGSAGVVLQANNGTIALSGMRFALPGGATSTVGIGYRMWVSALPSGNWGSWQGALLGFRTAANGAIAYMGLLSDGSLAVATGRDGSGLLGTTATPVIVASAWNHIEVKMLRHASAGTVEVRVNGVVKLSLTGLALGASDIGQLFIGVNYWNSGNLFKGDTFYKDIVIWDGTGTTGNDFQGSISVRDLYTTSDIALNWAASTGSTGYNLIDETTPNDADYIEADSTPPAAAVMGLTDLPVDVTTVRALIPIARAQKTDGGDCNLQVGLTPNNTDWDDGADRPLTTAFTYWWDVSELSPDTAAAWTPAEVNAAYVRFNRTL